MTRHQFLLNYIFNYSLQYFNNIKDSKIYFSSNKYCHLYKSKKLHPLSLYRKRQTEQRKGKKKREKKKRECTTKNGVLPTDNKKKQGAMSASAALDFTLRDQLVKH